MAGNQIVITVDDSEVRQRLGELQGKTNSIIYKAASRSVPTAKRVIRNELKKHYEAGSKMINASFKNRRNNYPSVILEYESGFANLRQWKGGKQTVRPQRATWEGKRPPKVYSGHSEKGHSNVKFSKRPKYFVQIGKKKNTHALFTRLGPERYPIRGVAGPAMVQGISEPEVWKEIKEQTEAYFLKRLQHETERVLEGN